MKLNDWHFYPQLDKAHKCHNIHSILYLSKSQVLRFLGNRSYFNILIYKSF